MQENNDRENSTSVDPIVICRLFGLKKATDVQLKELFNDRSKDISDLEAEQREIIDEVLSRQKGR